MTMAMMTMTMATEAKTAAISGAQIGADCVATTKKTAAKSGAQIGADSTTSRRWQTQMATTNADHDVDDDG